LERILRVGIANWTLSSDGGDGSRGVSGAGSEDGADSFRLRGRSLGIFAERSGGFAKELGLETAMVGLQV